MPCLESMGNSLEMQVPPRHQIPLKNDVSFQEKVMCRLEVAADERAIEPAGQASACSSTWMTRYETATNAGLSRRLEVSPIGSLPLCSSPTSIEPRYRTGTLDNLEQKTK